LLLFDWFVSNDIIWNININVYRLADNMPARYIIN